MDPATHRRLWDQLAWVAAGSASEDQRQQVEAHVAECAGCRDELALQRQMHAAFQHSAAQPHSAEPGLQRLLARIDAGLPPRAQPVPAPAPWTRWLAAAVLVQAVALAAAGAALWQRGDGAEYRTLSNAATNQAARLRLVPAPTLDFAGLQALLQRHGLAVVEASADGRALGLAPAAGTAADLPALLLRLRAEPGVLLAEAVLP